MLKFFYVLFLSTSFFVTAKNKKYINYLDVHPGHLKFIQIYGSFNDKKVKLKCGKNSIPLIKEKDRYIGYWAESYFSKEKESECHLKSGAKRLIPKVMVKIVTPFKYPSEKLTVNRKRVDLNKKDQKRVEREQKMLNKIYKISYPYPLFTKPFISPLDYSKKYHKLTSHYGKRRTFNGHHKGQHLGTDYRAKMNSVIPTSNKGKVVIARDLFYSGKTVIVDHGMNIFTVYGHLNKIEVVEGQFVVQGQKVGLSGKTGRVTGPHLHWGVKIHGNWVDGLKLISESQKQFSKQINL